MATRKAETFEKKFKPEWRDADKQPIDACDFPFDNARERALWTCVDPMIPSGMQFWVPGFHRVNAVGYIYTEIRWELSDGVDEYRRW